MKTKNLLSVMIYLGLFVFLFCSCSQAMDSTRTTDVSISLMMEEAPRDLSTDSVYSTGLVATSYEYKATHAANATAPGTQSSWTTLDYNGSSATLSEMALGNWTISVRAKNSTGGVIYQGSATVPVSKSNNSFTLTLKNSITDYAAGASAAAVTVSIGVTVPTLSSGTISVRYTTLANASNLNASGTGGTSVSMSSIANRKTTISGTGISYSTVSTNNKAYYGSVNLTPGFYVIQVLYKDSGTVVAGQTMAIHVEELTPFAINGTLSSGEYIELTSSNVSISNNNIPVSFSTAPAGYTGGHITATATYSGTVTSPTYKWYVNGVLDSGQTSASYTSTNTASAGQYSVTCVVKGTINGVQAIGYASTDITVAPPKVTFNGNGGTPSASNQSFTYNTAGTITATATRAGYQFAGWGTTTSGGTVYGENGHGTNTTITLTSDITLYAQWFQTGTLASTYESYDAGVYSGNTETDYTVTYTPVSTPDSYSWSVVGNSVGAITNGVGNNTIPTSGASGTLNLASADTYTVTCAAIKNGYRFESSIQLSLAGQVVGKAPSSASKYEENVSFIVYYQDGTNAVYNIEGTVDNITAVSCPGCLTFDHVVRFRVPREPNQYYYTYTEAGVTTAPFALYYEW